MAESLRTSSVAAFVVVVEDGGEWRMVASARGSAYMYAGESAAKAQKTLLQKRYPLSKFAVCHLGLDSAEVYS